MEPIRVKTGVDVFKAIQSISGDSWHETNEYGMTFVWRFPENKDAKVLFECWSGQIELGLVVNHRVVKTGIVRIKRETIDDEFISRLLKIFFRLRKA